MIILITYEEEGFGRNTVLVSHGVDSITMDTIILPNVSPASIGRFDPNLQEWILNE